MNESFQQFAWIDALISNWDGILVRMGGVSTAAFERDFAALAIRLANATSADAIAVLIDELLDLTEDTAASDYIRDLIRRSDVSGATAHRGAIGEAATGLLADTDLARAASTLAQVDVAAEYLGVPVLFATNRRVNTDGDQNDRFGGEYAREVTYGLAEVTIPVRVHRVGRMERPWFGAPKKTRHVVLGDIDQLVATDFATRLASEIQRAPQKDLLVFVHGYNVTFEEAARRAAQFATDMSFGGVVVLFSWPSAGATMRYPADEDSAAKTAEVFARFLKDLEGGPWERVHVVAHSMGNRVVVSGLANTSQLTLPLRNVVLVAGDVDTDLFEQQFPKVRGLVVRSDQDRVTSYATNSDRALWMSSVFHKTQRIGRITGTPFVAEGLETVDATAVDSSLLGHGYFGEQRSVLTDLGLMLREGLRAPARGLKPVKRWWAFPR